MSNRDPFENYKKRREIEVMERRFQEKAQAQRRRLEALLSESGDVEDLEERVTKEMEDFLAESTRTAEQMLEEVYDDEQGPGAPKEELKQEIRTFFADEPADAPPPAENVGGAPGMAQPTQEPIDLQAALDRIRQHGGSGVPTPAHRPPPEPEPERPQRLEDELAEAREQSRSEILETFDETYRQVNDLIVNRVQEQQTNAPAPPSEEEPAPMSEPAPGGSAADYYRQKIAAAASDPGLEAPTRAEPPAGFTPGATGGMVTDFGAAPITGAGGDGGGDGGTGGATNVFEAEPDEDRDIDDDNPPGWDIPVKPPPPGAWVVARQKEEGEAGLSGMAGDTYLLKKMGQEVKRLNRMYLVLVEKKVVTREEVEGPGGGNGQIEVDKGRPAKKKKPVDDEDDDDVVTIDDYEEDRYRPIDVTDGDFSLSNLVKDIHRLKTLRAVLVKKGVVTEKEMDKVKV